MSKPGYPRGWTFGSDGSPRHGNRIKMAWFILKDIFRHPLRTSVIITHSDGGLEVVDIKDYGERT